jgi:hypothetical protein
LKWPALASMMRGAPAREATEHRAMDDLSVHINEMRTSVKDLTQRLQGLRGYL